MPNVFEWENIFPSIFPLIENSKAPNWNDYNFNFITYTELFLFFTSSVNDTKMKFVNDTKMIKKTIKYFSFFTEPFTKYTVLEISGFTKYLVSKCIRFHRESGVLYKHRSVTRTPTKI